MALDRLVTCVAMPAARRALADHGTVDEAVRAAVRALVDAEVVIPVERLERVGSWCPVHGYFDDEVEHTPAACGLAGDDVFRERAA